MPEDALGPGDLFREQLTDLRLKIVEHFDDEELRTLCFDVGVDYDNLRGQGKEAKARELIDYMQRQGRLSDVIQACRKARPRVDWNFSANARNCQRHVAHHVDDRVRGATRWYRCWAC
jgi:Effector-associated domain 7